MKHRLKTILADKSGSTIIIIPFLVLGVIILGTTMWEYSRLNTVAQGSRDAVQSAITQACTEQYDQLYPGLREGYSGGYKLESTDWTENVDLININSKIDAKLGTSNGTKTNNGKTEYKISDMSVQLHNAPLAPDNPDITQQFTGTATYTLTVPLSFGWSALPPMVVPMKVTAGYSPQGELAVGGGDGSDDDGIPVTGVALNESALTLQKGEYASLSAEVSPDDATDPDVTWVSANDGVATVNRAGLVKGMDAGTTTVLAMSDGRMAECDVTVVNPVTHVALNKTNLKLNKGASETLVATVAPDNATDKSLWWTTSNSDICTIDANGKVTAVSPGTAEISVEARSGGVMATCQVTVESPVSGVSLNKTEMTLRPEASEKLTAMVTPDDATNPGVMWASSNPEICTVDQDGNVTAVRAGTAVISATAKDNVHMAQCTVTVTIPVTGVTLSKTYLSIIKGASDILYATVWPADATNKTITWSSSNSAICSVDQSGIITGTGVGTATITVTTQDGGFTAACTVDVKPNTYVVSANAIHGHVEGTGTYWAGMNVTLTAVPDYNYEFVNWTDTSGRVIGVNTTYTIYNLSADVTVTANFKKITYQWTYSISNNGYCPQFINSSETTATYSAYTNVKKLKDTDKLKNNDIFVYYTFTFTEPTTFKAGSSILLVGTTTNIYSMMGGLMVNGTDAGVMRDYDQNAMGYYFKSDTVVNTITVYARASSLNMSITEKAYVRMNNGTTFMLNSTGTSENQNLDIKYGVIVNSDPTFGSSYFTFDDVKSYDDSGAGFSLQFMYPMDIDYITLHNEETESSGFNTPISYTFTASDVNGSNYKLTCIDAPLASHDDQWVLAHNLGTLNDDDSTFDMEYDLDGTRERKFSNYCVLTGSVDTSKVTNIFIRWACHTGTRMYVTVHLKDGSSFNVNTSHAG